MKIRTITKTTYEVTLFLTKEEANNLRCSLHDVVLTDEEGTQTKEAKMLMSSLHSALMDDALRRTSYDR